MKTKRIDRQGFLIHKIKEKGIRQGVVLSLNEETDQMEVLNAWPEDRLEGLRHALKLFLEQVEDKLWARKQKQWPTPEQEQAEITEWNARERATFWGGGADIVGRQQTARENLTDLLTEINENTNNGDERGD